MPAESPFYAELKARTRGDEKMREHLPSAAHSALGGACTGRRGHPPRCARGSASVASEGSCVWALCGKQVVGRVSIVTLARRPWVETSASWPALLG